MSVFKKIFYSLFLSYFLILLQSSFFPHFEIFAYEINIIIILIFSVLLLKEKLKSFVFFNILFLGFFSDIFSLNFFGFWIVLYLTFFLFFSLFIRKNIRLFDHV
jgi:hypothetical protein